MPVTRADGALVAIVLGGPGDGLCPYTPRDRGENGPIIPSARAPARRSPPGQGRSSRPRRSRFRAPARMPYSPMLPSWHAYSKIGPSVRRNGIMTVKGAV